MKKKKEKKKNKKTRDLNGQMNRWKLKSPIATLFLHAIIVRFVHCVPINPPVKPAASKKHPINKINSLILEIKLFFVLNVVAFDHKKDEFENMLFLKGSPKSKL